jgi:hypothetical protein
MQVDEILVWRNWLKLHEQVSELLPPEWIARRAGDVGARPQTGDRFDYNVRIGVNLDPGPDFPDNIRRAAIASRSLRVDAMGWNAGAPVLYEVKRRAGPQNVGQLLVYRDVWKASGIPTAPPQLVLVCSDFTSHILPTAQASQIRIDLVPTDFSWLSPRAIGRPLP